MGDASTNTFLVEAGTIALTVARWLVLIAATVLVLFVTWLLLNLI